MKVELDVDGTLSVTPESRLERYALGKWLKDWERRKVQFCVNFESGPAPVELTVPIPLKRVDTDA